MKSEKHVVLDFVRSNIFEHYPMQVMISNLSNLSRGGAFTRRLFCSQGGGKILLRMKLGRSWFFFQSFCHVFVLSEANRRTDGGEKTMMKCMQMNYKTTVEGSANYSLRKPTRESMISSLYFFPLANCVFRIQAERAQSRKKAKDRRCQNLTPHCIGWSNANYFNIRLRLTNKSSSFHAQNSCHYFDCTIYNNLFHSIEQFI